jgi:uncharacterized protein
MTVFIDTSALFAILDEEDPHHHEAVQLHAAALASDDVVTHNYVHVEAEQLARRRLGAAAAARLIDELLPGVQTVWVDEEIHSEALRAIQGGGRNTSLVDNVSFIIMRRLQISEAIAFDADFAAEGFARPRPSREEHRLSQTPASYNSDAETAPASQLVGVAEIASRSGHSANTVQSWRRRHASFPAPAANLASGPVWLWPSIDAWIENGRVRRPSVRAASSA